MKPTKMYASESLLHIRHPDSLNKASMLRTTRVICSKLGNLGFPGFRFTWDRLEQIAQDIPDQTLRQCVERFFQEVSAFLVARIERYSGSFGFDLDILLRCDPASHACIRLEMFPRMLPRVCRVYASALREDIPLLQTWEEAYLPQFIYARNRATTHKEQAKAIQRFQACRQKWEIRDSDVIQTFLILTAQSYLHHRSIVLSPATQVA